MGSVNFNQDINLILWQAQMMEQGDVESEEEDFDARCRDAEENFIAMKENYPDLFSCNAIKEANRKQEAPDTQDVDIDDFTVEYTKDTDGLSCFGVGTGFAVMARAKGEEDCIALCFATSIEPKEVLDKMTKMLLEMECDEETIEFFIVGGQLPYVEEDGEVTDSIENENKYLELSKEYPIKGVQFNHAEDMDSLKVIITPEEITWQKRLDVDSDSEEETLKRKLDDDEEGPNKRPKPNSFGGLLLNGQAPDFV